MLNFILETLVALSCWALLYKVIDGMQHDLLSWPSLVLASAFVLVIMLVNSRLRHDDRE